MTIIPVRRAVAPWLATLALSAGGAPAHAQAPVSGGNGTIYMGTYANSIYVIDEATLTVTDQIPLQGIPLGLNPSFDRQRFYTLDARFETVEVVDIASRRSIDRFSLSEGNTTVRIWGMDVDPQERFGILLVKTYTKHTDRYEIGEPTLLRYDLRQHAVTDTIPWPEGEERDFARMIFSPDGDLLYFFTDEVLVYETEGFTEVDRWDLSQPLEDGLGRFNFGFPSNIYEEPGFYTGLFRVTDPVQNRRMMGVARVNLVERSVDFYTLGPSESVSFTLSPDRKKAYGLQQSIGHYEFWTFDLEGRRVQSKVEFDGRPRMAIMPSSNGQLLYIYNAGNTIDVYQAESFQHLRTVELNADMTGFVMMPGQDGPG